MSEVLDATLGAGVVGETLEFKACFGAVASTVDGAIFATCGKFGLALKLPPDLCAELLERQGGTPLRYFAKGHVKKAYVVIPAHMLDDGPALGALVGQAVDYARSSVR